jgi:hypothetical protein
LKGRQHAKVTKKVEMFAFANIFIKINDRENLGMMLSSSMKNGKKLALKNISSSSRKRIYGKTLKRKSEKILLD